MRTTLALSLFCALVAVMLWSSSSVAIKDCCPRAEPTDHGTRVWFTPNMGSTDMLELFSAPSGWAFARSKVDVFKFYAGQVSTLDSCQGNPICGDNYAVNLVNANAFTLLDGWGKKIAVESAYYPPGEYGTGDCVAGADLVATNVALGNNNIAVIDGNGGSTDYLVMDEPLYKWTESYYFRYTETEETGRDCYTTFYDTVAEVATDVAAFIAGVQATYPAVKIGQMDMYPENDVAWIKAYNAALLAAGVKLAFFHLDFHGQRYDQYDGWGLPVDVNDDLRELRDYFARYSIPFGVVYTDAWWEAHYASGYTDEAYYGYAMDWIETANEAIHASRDVIFQSWTWGVAGQSGQRITPINMPDSGSAYTHTRLILEGMTTVGAE